MINLLISILDWICLFLVAYIIYLVIRCFLTLRKNHLFLKLAALISFFLFGNIVVFPEEVTGAFGTLGILILAVLILYKDRMIVKLSTVFILFPIATAISYITENLGFLIWYHLFQTTLSPLNESILEFQTILLRVLWWYLIYRLTRTWISRITQELTMRMWLVIDALSITSCISIITIIYKSTIMASYVAYPACIACIFTSLGCCYLCSYISKTLKADMEIQTLKYQQSYYHELEENQNAVRKIRHDMKNHLNIIGTFLRDDDVVKAKEYFSDLSDEFTAGTHDFCSNSIINAVLNAKYNLASQEGIDCTFKLDLEADISVDDISLCSLFANSLDNAIEASIKIPSPAQRWISLSARCHNGHLSCEISNAKQNAIHTANGQIKTDKADRASHGIGLKNIRGVVQKYDGTMDISYTDEKFTLTMFI